jgi:hypothetical protein
MRKQTRIIKNLALALIVEYLAWPLFALAQSRIENPAPDYFVDLSRLGRENTFQGLLGYLIVGLLGAAGLLAVFFIIFAGFQYLTSRGNEEQAQASKKTLTNAIIGLVIIILSYVIVVVVARALYGRV